jgi:hypothetical protein
MKRFMYVAVRRDLSLPQQVVQACHAAIEASWTLWADEIDEHPSVIVLGMKNEKALEKFKKYLDDLGYIHYDEFREPDMENQLASISTVALPESCKELFKKYQLLK